MPKRDRQPPNKLLNNPIQTRSKVRPNLAQLIPYIKNRRNPINPIASTINQHPEIMFDQLGIEFDIE
ncbi:hypothetical protein Hanom_Chr10g00938021 [Helianthus anomalus]